MRKRVCGEGNSRDEEGHVGIENTWRGEGVRRPGRGVIVILLSDGYRYFQASNPRPSAWGRTFLRTGRRIDGAGSDGPKLCTSCK